ncbi:two-component sensor histidine kinase [Paenibacillus sp. PK3_47]|uniref:cache domain-containing sensor histidine kinase n=1 Tax=Paenibacillus sp. PK3_47 TaxID=2072642 RepID=UPI00201D47AE|nr:sensor histidine kinase [Paenibacillus sp. PK3_47]UQZ35557.1 two-component sensor histidine kinase [Paenibacillus sp. PK3_47]
MKIIVYIRKWFGRLRFKSKVIAIFLPLLIFSLLILGALSSHLFSRSLIDRTTRNVADESQLILSRTDYILRSAETAANIMVTNINRLYETYPAVQTAAVTLEQIRFSNLMQSRLSTDLSIFREVDAAVFVGNDGTVYPSYTSGRDEGGIAASGMLEQVKEADSYGTSHWFDMQQRDYMTPDPASPVLTLGKIVINIDTGETLGTLFLIIKEEQLSAFLQSSDPAAPKSYYFMDKQLRIVAAADKNSLLTQIEPSMAAEIGKNHASTRAASFSYREDGNLVTVSHYGRMDWELINVVSLQLLTADVRQNVRLTALVGALCLIFSLFGASLLSRMVAGPLERLTRAMRQVVSGDLEPVVEAKTEDEIGTIAEAFNFMVGRVRELLHKVTQEQNRKREYELALISAQIKPHFLYNTLDTIYVLNELDRNEEARDTTKALADFYRMVLNKGRELIILEKEAEITDDYLAIMQIRYPDVFRYEIDIPAELSGTPVPKLSLQPLVENAIYHGLKKKGSKGFIRIQAFAVDGKVFVQVIDNGVGMEEERIESIMSGYSPEEETRSIGTYSVQQRLSLYFGEEYGLTVQSALGEGTTVELSLPMLGNEKRDEQDVQGDDR